MHGQWDCAVRGWRLELNCRSLMVNYCPEQARNCPYEGDASPVLKPVRQLPISIINRSQSSSKYIQICKCWPSDGDNVKYG